MFTKFEKINVVKYRTYMTTVHSGCVIVILEGTSIIFKQLLENFLLDPGWKNSGSEIIIPDPMTGNGA